MNNKTGQYPRNENPVEGRVKVRFKFSKEGPVRFLGHLDTMRYFQKAIRRADFPVVFSSGFSPHMLLSFASPLGVGMEGMGEYFDLEMAECIASGALVDRLNAEMAEGFAILNAVRVPEGKASNAMSLVAAADYLLKGPDITGELLAGIGDFLSSDEILITKTGKSGERDVNIRPFIYEMAPFSGEDDEPVLFLRLACASANYTRPDQVMGAFLKKRGLDAGQGGPGISYRIRRLEVYAGTEAGFVPLDALGERIE